ncbi:hypothetical protein AVEN_173524-1 [Araneus ventricosus]|uniref:Uncharacterized protein n=1 Tax=Araneus ventricosus TaxID=182803 RepID=A0A4Y2N2L8_ARAVE|nr:hypothetical protein AVEN_173524-1 [Araneus ventricosus]
MNISQVSTLGILDLFTVRLTRGAYTLDTLTPLESCRYHKFLLKLLEDSEHLYASTINTDLDNLPTLWWLFRLIERSITSVSSSGHRNVLNSP